MGMSQTTGGAATARTPAEASMAAHPCAYDPELFWPVSINSNQQIAYAKRVCRHCPVVAACLRWAEALPDDQKYVGQVAGGVFWPDRHRRVTSSTDPRTRRKPLVPIKHGTPGGYRMHIQRNQLACDACRAAAVEYQRQRRANKRAVAA